MSLVDQLADDGKYLYNEINAITIGVLLILLAVLPVIFDKTKKEETTK